MHSYIDLLKTESQKGNLNFPEFIKLLYSSNALALESFVVDILSGRTDYLQEAFPSSKNIYTDEIVFHELTKLEDSTYQIICPLLEKIFSEAVEKKGPDSSTVIKNVIALTVLQQRGLSVDYIKKQIESSSVTEDIKTLLAVLFSSIDSVSCRSYLEEDQTGDDLPSCLIPAYISAYKKEAPDKALKILTKLERQPSNFEYFKLPINTALENLLIKKNDIPAYLSLSENMPKWVKQEFKSVLSKPRFIRNNVNEEVAKHRSKFYERTILEAIKIIINKLETVKYQDSLCKEEEQQSHTPI
ncbi:MAG: hypothetical protein LBL79_01095 [Prevotella sp.]|jgi:hypothetical protein|nr:hypothetical protein [Prevotella sp.]